MIRNTISINQVGICAAMIVHQSPFMVFFAAGQISVKSWHGTQLGLHHAFCCLFRFSDNQGTLALTCYTQMVVSAVQSLHLAQFATLPPGTSH